MMVVRHQGTVSASETRVRELSTEELLYLYAVLRCMDYELGNDAPCPGSYRVSKAELISFRRGVAWAAKVRVPKLETFLRRVRELASLGWAARYLRPGEYELRLDRLAAMVPRPRREAIEAMARWLAGWKR